LVKGWRLRRQLPVALQLALSPVGRRRGLLHSSRRILAMVDTKSMSGHFFTKCVCYVSTCIWKVLWLPQGIYPVWTALRGGLACSRRQCRPA